MIKDTQARYGSFIQAISGVNYILENCTLTLGSDATDVLDEVGEIAGAIYRFNPAELSATAQFATDGTATPGVGWTMHVTTGVYPTGSYLITSVGSARQNKDIAKLNLSAREKLN